MGTAAVTEALAQHEQRKQRLLASLAERSTAAGLRLDKDTSNLFRSRQETSSTRLDVRDFNHVLQVDPTTMTCDVEGMTRYDELVDACLAHGVMPAVVPQLRSITIGGAVTGLGIESSSFRYGLVHETVEELEVLLADGKTVVARPDNEHSELFFGFPNSYGTLGYALRLRIKVVPVRPYVQLQHVPHQDADAYFEDLTRWCASDVDFVDGTVFGPEEMYITVGRFTDEAPYTSDYTYERIYYRSIRQRREDYLTIRDYLWRWDTDWFWCSKNLYAQNPIVRRILGRGRLNSVTYARIMRWNNRWGVTRRLNRMLGRHTESVIQDVEVPVAQGKAFLDFYFEHIRFTPLWVCPIRRYDPRVQFDLYPLDPDVLYVNFGFWDVISSREPMPDGYHNRLIEEKVRDLGGMKSLYSDVYYPEDEFWEIYNKPAYDALKARYDPEGRFKDLYRKTVLKQ